MKHPLDLLIETKGLNGYQFQDWLQSMTDTEVAALQSLAYSLTRSLQEEKERRESIED